MSPCSSSVQCLGLAGHVQSCLGLPANTINHQELLCLAHLVNSDLHGNNLAGHLGGLGVVLLAESHDVHTLMWTQGTRHCRDVSMHSAKLALRKHSLCLAEMHMEQRAVHAQAIAWCMPHLGTQGRTNRRRWVGLAGSQGQLNLAGDCAREQGWRGTASRREAATEDKTGATSTRCLLAGLRLLLF